MSAETPHQSHLRSSAAGPQETQVPSLQRPPFEGPSVCASAAGSLSPGMGLALDRRGVGILPEPPQVAALSAHLEMKTSHPHPLQGCSGLRRVGNGASLHTCHSIT